MQFLGKKGNIVIILLISIIFALPAFAGEDGTAKNAFKKGQYIFAVNRLAQKLRDKDDHQDNINLMEECLKYAYTTNIRKAEDLEIQGDLDGAIQVYGQLRDMSDNVSLLTVRKEERVDGHKEKVRHTFNVVDVTDQYRSLVESATENYYQNGLVFEKNQDWRNAAISFRKARNYRKSYKDVDDRYERCRKKGMIKIAVMPFVNQSGKYEFGSIGDFISAEIVSDAIDADPEFLMFISREYLDQLLAEQGLQKSDIVDPQTAVKIGKMIGVQAFVFGKIFSIIPETPRELRTDYKKTKLINIYDKKSKKSFPMLAYCDYSVVERKRAVRVQASYQVIDVQTGEIVSSQTITQDKKDGCTWIAVHKGNDDIIPADHKSRVTPGGERILAGIEMMTSDCASEMAKDLASKLVQQFEE